jgi:hypothetical protein
MVAFLLVSVCVTAVVPAVLFDVTSVTETSQGERAGWLVVTLFHRAKVYQTVTSVRDSSSIRDVNDRKVEALVVLIGVTDAVMFSFQGFAPI